MRGDYAQSGRHLISVLPGDPWLSRCGKLLCLLLMMTGVFIAPKYAGSESGTPFRIGFSAATFGYVNENDAMAAVRVWAQAIAQEKGIPADPQPKVFKSFDEITGALGQKAVDCINITLIEYEKLSKRVAGGNIVLAVKGGSVMEEYVLVAHRASGIEKLSDLKGRTLGLLQSSRTVLSEVWLNTLLLRTGLGPADGFFKQIFSHVKIDKAVLTVFFRQMDACLVTLSAFKTMIELNPQIGQQLTTIETSPPVVPNVFFFRADYNSPVKGQVMNEIGMLHLSPAGRQILTVFQADSLQENPLNTLDGSLELLAEHQRLRNHFTKDSTGKPPSETSTKAKQPDRGNQHP